MEAMHCRRNVCKKKNKCFLNLFFFCFFSKKVITFQIKSDQILHGIIYDKSKALFVSYEVFLSTAFESETCHSNV